MGQKPAPLQTVTDDVRRALEEDVGSGDLTAELIPASENAVAHVVTREDMVVCGRAWFDECFHQLDSGLRIEWKVDDGDLLAAGTVLCTLEGNARALLTGERAALNFLQLLSGTATISHRYSSAVAGTGAAVLDTRKTLPGLRQAQKYAVRSGGARNHRIGLFDAILIKDNHIRAAGSVTAALEQAQGIGPKGTLIEIEVENLEQLQEALDAGARRVLLDNFSVAELRQAVKQNGGRAELEASGGVSLDNVRQIAETGVDYISVGELTKHVHAIDLSMRFD
ncbi:MAG: carboxylating nicotinate-nucleotide diphosphorylase [Acidiferrobacteraceae bacterium]|jgi:nicotinate-nucleotide pyrophosphorylase (carboxylating)